MTRDTIEAHHGARDGDAHPGGRGGTPPRPDDGPESWLGGGGGVALLAALGGVQIALWLAPVASGHGTTEFAWRAAALFAVQIAGLAVAWRRNDRLTAAVIVGVAVGIRLVALSWTPDLSSDLHRYLWDGRVQESGRSPYAAPPSDPALAPLRDDVVWPAINRPDAITVYPPGSQVAFLALVKLGGSSTDAIRLAAGAVELVALGIVGFVLRRRRTPIGRIVIYAWSPLIVAEFWISGHVDALVLPLVLCAALAAQKGRLAWAGVLIGAATSLKLYPILLLAAVPAAGRRVTAAAALGVVALVYAPYTLRSGVGVAGFLPQYVGVAEDFNLGVRGFVQDALSLVGVPFARQAAMALCVAAFVAVAWRVARAADVGIWSRFGTVTLAFVVLLPTAVHPWYAAWLVPFQAISPTAAGVWILGALPLSYLKYGTPDDSMPAWVPMLEWFPAYVLLGGAWWRRQARGAGTR